MSSATGTLLPVSSFHERLARAAARAGYLRRGKPGRPRKGEKTQAELAALADMSPSELTRWLNGERVGLDEVLRQAFLLARATRAPLPWLLADEGPDIETPHEDQAPLSGLEPRVARLEAMVQQTLMPGVPGWPPDERLIRKNARLALRLLLSDNVPRDYVIGFANHARYFGATWGETKWTRYSRTQFKFWHAFQSDKSPEEWLDSQVRDNHSPPPDAVKKALPWLFPPGMPHIEAWDVIVSRLNGVWTAEEKKRAKRGEPAPTAEELVELMKRAG